MSLFSRKKPLFFVLLSSLLACSGRFGVATFDPVEGSVDENVLLTITGAGFSAETRVRLENAERAIDLLAPQREGSDTLRVTVPAGTPKGEYDLVLVDGEEEVRLPRAYSALGEVRLIAIDVGQGDATLIVGPTGRSVLFDVGDSRSDVLNSSGQSPITAVRARLDAEGIFAPDIVIASHYHLDHVGALDALLRGPDGQLGTPDDRIPPGGIFDRGDPREDGPFTEALYRQVTQGLRQSVALSQEFDLGGGVTLRVVATDGFVEGSLAPINIDRRDENQRGVALLLTVPRRNGLQPFTALLLGDLSGGGGSGEGTVDVEGPLSANLGHVDVIRLAHHGSDTSTSLSLLQNTTPRATLISVGEDNSFCHPDERIIGRLSTFAPQARTFLTSGGILTDGLVTNCCICSATQNVFDATPAQEVVANGDIITRVSLFTEAFDINGVTF